MADHTKKWLDRKRKLSLKLSSAQRADAHYLENAHFILELAKNAAQWFKQGNVEKKRRVLDILLSNCSYSDGNIDVELKSVFGMILESAKTRNWCAR